MYFQVTVTCFTTVSPLPLSARVWSVEGWQARGIEHAESLQEFSRSKRNWMPMSCSMGVLPSTGAVHRRTLVAGTGPARGIKKNEFLKEEQRVARADEPLVPWQKPYGARRSLCARE